MTPKVIDTSPCLQPRPYLLPTHILGQTYPVILLFPPPQAWCRKCLHSSTGVSPPFQSRDPCLRSESI